MTPLKKIDHPIVSRLVIARRQLRKATAACQRTAEVDAAVHATIKTLAEDCHIQCGALYQAALAIKSIERASE